MGRVTENSRYRPTKIMGRVPTLNGRYRPTKIMSMVLLKWQVPSHKNNAQGTTLNGRTAGLLGDVLTDYLRGDVFDLYLILSASHAPRPSYITRLIYVFYCSISIVLRTFICRRFLIVAVLPL